jgi:hypothetical protein
MNRDISMLPEDRRDGGLFMDFNIVSNIAAASLAAFARSALFSNSGMRDMAEKHLRDLRIAAPDVDREVRNLSGGNQKKVMLTEWLARIPRVLLVDKPTRDTVDLSRRIAARLRRRRHQLRLRLDCLPADAVLGIYSPFWFMAVIVAAFALLAGKTLYFRQPIASAAMRRRPCCQASMSITRCLVSSSSWAYCRGTRERISPHVSIPPWVSAGQGVELKVVTAVVLGAPASPAARAQYLARFSACFSSHCCRTP